MDEEPLRKIDLGSAPTEPQILRLPITQLLKKSATEYVSVGLLDWDAIEENRMSDVDLKCSSSAAAQTVFSNLMAFYAVGTGSFIEAPRLPNEGGKTVVVPLAQYFPNWFDELAHDVESTDLRIIEIDAALINKARVFVRAYGNNLIVSRSPVDSPNNLLRPVTTAQKLLVRFLKTVVSLTNDNPPHLVIIRDDFTVEIDGQIQNLTKGQMWALCALAIFRNRRLISHKEFMLVYSNEQRESNINKQDVSNVLRTLDKVLPRFSYRSDGQKRCTISNLFIESELTDQELGEILPRKDSENNYGDISLENNE